MNWMNKLERRFGRYAIPNLSRYFVIAIIVGYIGALLAPNVMDYLTFSPYYILRGQVWRLVSWVVIPATGLDFWGILFLICVLMWGSSLEFFLGTFRMNVYLVQGILISDIGAFLIYFLSHIFCGDLLAVIGFYGIPVQLSTYYILMSMLLALAICMPEGEVRLYFVLPIKMKWMLLFELLFLGYEVFRYFKIGISSYGGILGVMIGLAYSAQIIFAIGSMFLFFWFSKTRISRRQKKRQREFRTQFAQPRPGSGITQHKCAICGRTEVDAPNMVFRYCSKCKGNMEYCEEHLFTHRHVE